MTIDRAAYALEFDESFDSATLDESRWMPEFLPHWTTADRAAARFDIADSQLRLRIDEDQPDWAPEYDGTLRVSNLQTGTRSGAVGGADGQHRFRPGLVVRSAHPERRLYLPRYGLIEARAKALADPTSMVALWLIGFEDEPADSGEICLFEIFGNEVDPGRALVGMGVHPHHDPRIQDDFRKIPLDGNATDFHTYSVEWMPGRLTFSIDDATVLELDQAPDYPLQLMLGIFELDVPRAGTYPKEFFVDFVRGYRRTA